jgi:Asp-tRNA(Asn)/Glu-tRNA(Gln) amidotransferase A subunit family amidase
MAKSVTVQDSEYDLRSVKLPYLAGGMLRLFVSLVEGPLRGLLTPSLFKSAGITWLRQQRFDEPPTLQPFNYTGIPAVAAQAVPLAEWPSTPALPGLGFRYSTVQDYAAAYRDGKITPEDVAHRVLEAVVTSNSAEPPLRAIIAMDREDVLRQARDSTQRIREGCPLSVFDGVPVAVKDEVDMLPYPTTVGTSFMGTSPCKEDSTVVARMRSAGALLIGKANMHEIGIGVTGLNPHHGTARNPYNPDHFTGGSSSGPGAAVAAGLSPVAIGADGGGSIRIPSSFCGVVGIKPTFGRVSEFGAAPLCWSVAHLGPLAATATDAALAYSVMAGPDPRDPNSMRQPMPTMAGWDRLDLGGLKMGVYWPWFRHATPEMVAACETMLHKFESMGAEVREVVLPDLEAGRIAHTITIAGEMVQSLDRYYEQHHREYGADVRVSLALARCFSTMDFVQSQQVRTRLIANFARALEGVDMIMTPSTALPAPLIPQAALPDGESDLSTLVEIMRFATPANMTGLPAISFPVGYTEDNLPLGMQAIGRSWQEPTLLRMALAAERVVDRKSPELYYRILPE